MILVFKQIKQHIMGLKQEPFDTNDEGQREAQTE